MTEISDSKPDQDWRPTPSVLAKIADELRHNDECGSREPLSDDEYMDDARALLRIVDDHRASEVDRLRAENAMLRLAFCDEAYIVAVQTLDVKALGKGRREILTTQAIRMLKVGLNEGMPRGTRETDAGLVRRAREKLAELSGPIDEGEAPRA